MGVGVTEQEAFNGIKTAMSTQPVLAHLDSDKPFCLKIDASWVAMGAVLSQRKEDGRRHPVAYMSSSFLAPERNYDTHDKELLMIIQALKNWQIHLEGTKDPIIVFTYHCNLEYWKEAQNFNRRHTRWLQIIASYNFQIHYHPGKQSDKLDAPSRREDYRDVPDKPQTMLSQQHFAAALQELPVEGEIQGSIQRAIHLDLSLEAVLEFMLRDHRATPASVKAKFKDYRI